MLAQPQKAKAARMTKLSAVSVEVSVGFIVFVSWFYFEKWSISRSAFRRGWRGFFVAAGRAFSGAALVAAVAALFAAGAAFFGGLHFLVLGLVLCEHGRGGEGECH